jgi:DNA-binding transcriptional ArsR family regulator
MPEKSFLLVSLEEEKAKKLAQVLSNDTARKILDVLSKKEYATETELSKKLKFPLSTIHYNMQHLVKADLVKDETYSYSKKGKEVIHYSLSNKYVIIAPKKTDKLKQKLKEFLPVLLITVVASVVIKYLWKPLEKAPVLAAMDIAEEAVRAAPVVEKAPIQVIIPQDIAFWFLVGAIASLIVFFIWTEFILKKLKR